MKNLNRLRQQLAYEPFQSFWLETVGGTRIQVERREWFWESLIWILSRWRIGTEP